MTDARNLVLVVDDNETHRYALTRTLRRAGLEVREAATAEAALASLAAEVPGVVLLDVQLPDMDGRELCRRIKAEPATASVLVVQISATHVRDEDMVRALDWGADASLAEPIDPGILVATVRALFRIRHAETALRDALERADAARRAAEEANRAKDEFLATLSHELRSPLSAILTWATLLRTEGLDEEQRRRALETIERNARAQAALVEDLLDMSRIVAGGIRLQVGAVDLGAVVEAATERVRPAAEGKGVALHLDLQRLDGLVAGDAARLQQAVANVVGNAVKFTPAGGRVDLRLVHGDDVAHIEVRDTGRGIPPELLGVVFERFRQVDPSSTRRESGLGLGLAIVRHIVELHGGRVEAHSPGPNRGTTVRLSLPLRPAAEEAAAVAPQVRTAERLEGVRLLMVEDDADAREANRVVLAAAGAEVLAVGSAEEALAALGTASFDVLVSDIAMPDMDGYELLARARRIRPDAATMPAIAVTAFAASHDQRRAGAAGFARHVAKPLEPAELVKAVAAVLGERQ